MTIAKIEIWEDNMVVLAKVTRFDNSSEVITWNNTKVRTNILKHIDGYTLIEDKRLVK